MSEPGTLVHDVDYRRLATQRRQITGTIALARLPRVGAVSACKPAEGDTVAVDLLFFEDAQRRVRVEGRIQTTLRLTCQRCLREYDQPMDAPVAGVVVGDDEAAANVPRADEPVLADGDTLDVHALVSDELLLALPGVERCDRDDCRAQYESAPEDSDQGDEEKRKNPFAVLQQLKRDD